MIGRQSRDDVMTVTRQHAIDQMAYGRFIFNDKESHGTAPRHPISLAALDISACPPAPLPKDPTDIKAMLDVLVKAERCAVAGYSHICKLTTGKDHRTYDLSLAILHEEIEHEAWVAEFLGEGPSGHFHRTGMGISRNSPYVSKFLHL